MAEVEESPTHITMNTTVASGRAVWQMGVAYEVGVSVDAETARAWVRDRVASAGDGKTTEEVRAEVEVEQLPRASEIHPEQMTGETKTDAADVLPADYPSRGVLIAGGFDTRAKVDAAPDEGLLKLKPFGPAALASVRGYGKA